MSHSYFPLVNMAFQIISYTQRGENIIVALKQHYLKRAMRVWTLIKYIINDGRKL